MQILLLVSERQWSLMLRRRYHDYHPSPVECGFDDRCTVNSCPAGNKVQSSLWGVVARPSIKAVGTIDLILFWLLTVERKKYLTTVKKLLAWALWWKQKDDGFFEWGGLFPWGVGNHSRSNYVGAFLATLLSFTTYIYSWYMNWTVFCSLR